MTFVVLSTHNLLTFLVVIVVTVENIASFACFYLLKLWSCTTTIIRNVMKIVDFLIFFWCTQSSDPKMSDFGLHIWVTLQYIPHLVVTWDPNDII